MLVAARLRKAAKRANATEGPMKLELTYCSV
jgi:hypothetical protein